MAGGRSLIVERRHRGYESRERARERKAVSHDETALGIASSFDWRGSPFGIHYSLAELFFNQGRSDDAHTHIKRAKAHAVNNRYLLARAMGLQAEFWYKEGRFEDAKSEALRAVDVMRRSEPRWI